MRNVCALALPGVNTFDLACATQVFGNGPGVAGEPHGFALTVCRAGPRRGLVPTSDGVTLGVPRGLDAVADAEIVMVPGRFPPAAPPPREVIVALRAAHARGALIASICVGAFVLAYAGLLDGRRATTHWAYADELAQLFPAVDVDSKPLYVDGGSILTSAGLAAGLDLCLHIVRREAGTTDASRLANWNVVSPHREGGQAQFIPARRYPSLDQGLAPTLHWARERLHEPITLADLAAHAHVSERTLSRRFMQALGVPPKRWLLDQRVGLARELLEDPALPIEAVARRAGFPTVAALRHQLDVRIGMTPTAYRRVFAPPD